MPRRKRPAPRKGDRLEPCELLPCTASFDNLRPEGDATLAVTFWRRSRGTPVRRRIPRLAEETHLSPDRSISADNLHLLSLGVASCWISCAFHLLIIVDAFNTWATAKVAKQQATLTRLKANMGLSLIHI